MAPTGVVIARYSVTEVATAVNPPIARAIAGEPFAHELPGRIPGPARPPTSLMGRMRPLPPAAMRNAKRSDLTGNQRGPSPRSTSSRESIAAFLSSSVCFRERSNCSVLPTLLPIRTNPPSPTAIPTIIRSGVTVARPSTKQISNAAPPKAHARPATASLRLRRITSRNRRSAPRSRSICSAGVGSASNIELSGGVAGRSDQELAAVHPQIDVATRSRSTCRTKMTFPSQSIACPRQVASRRSLIAGRRLPRTSLMGMADFRDARWPREALPREDLSPKVPTREKKEPSSCAAA